MALDVLADMLPPYARDMAQNLRIVADEVVLNDAQKWGAFLACAYACGETTVLKQVAREAGAFLTPEAFDAARSAATIMSMNNVYYRALHLMHNQEYAALPAKLRMNVLGNPGVPKIDYELWCFAVSAINGCGLCLDSHEKVLRSHAVTAVEVQFALRIAAIVTAVGVVLRAEAACRD
ncbi:carboxymuconolactone decarboxylase family protein [Asticcacaulis sp. AND118]|uniref:carboxymuconolactone decarboxylase family protein n=1 Tax=Asticcacaulis sp. AND118 TaxID=2840468 RepID=UPI001CFFC700|nr:carboxymuconolactone decarboxylase family protein [Asticcacaulis sp. AND118]UDF03380.1 carboxymuconolactone decarboxylase family protein [Asticcacaulis sp. AND118]